MLTDIRMQILILFLVVDHAEQNDLSLVLWQRSLGVLVALGIAIMVSKVLYGPLAALVGALGIHRHSFE